MENERQAEKDKTAIVWLQCLKCQAEFCQPLSKNLMRALSEPDIHHGHQEKMEKEHTTGKNKTKKEFMKCSHCQESQLVSCNFDDDINLTFIVSSEMS